MRDLAFHFGDVGGGDAEFWFSQISDDRDDALLLFIETPPRVERLKLLDRIFSHQYENCAATLQQVLDQEFADKAGCASDEVSHGSILGSEMFL